MLFHRTHSSHQNRRHTIAPFHRTHCWSPPWKRQRRFTLHGDRRGSRRQRRQSICT
uniref:Uncharacterized protein n=1 Tax=Arundo donax TaxID=35708 RepID=A0A0A9CC30_ARUDO